MTIGERIRFPVARRFLGSPFCDPFGAYLGQHDEVTRKVPDVLCEVVEARGMRQSHRLLGLRPLWKRDLFLASL